MASKFGGNVPPPDFGNIEKIDTSQLKELIGLEEEVIDVGKKINKMKIEIRTNDSYVEKLVNKLNKIASYNSDTMFNAIKKGTTLSNYTDNIDKIEKFYQKTIPTLRDGLEDLYASGQIHDIQYDWFYDHLNTLDSAKYYDESIKYLSNFESQFENKLESINNHAKDSINHLYSNIYNSDNGAIEITGQRKIFEKGLKDLKKMIGDNSYYDEDIQKLEDYFTVMAKVDDMTSLEGFRKFDQNTFDQMIPSLERLGIDANDLKDTLQSVFQPQNVESETQAIGQLLNQIGLLKDALIQVKNILSTISNGESGTYYSQLFDNINKISEAYNSIPTKDGAKNPFQAIINSLNEFQNQSNNFNTSELTSSFDKISEAVTNLESTLSTLPEIMKTALLSINGLDINVSGFEKSEEAISSQIRLLNAYEEAYMKLVNHQDKSIANMALMGSSGRRAFDIEEYATTTEKIAAYQSQFELINKRIAAKYTKTVNTGMLGDNWKDGIKKEAKTWADFVDESYEKEIKAASRQKNYYKNKDVRAQEAIIEKMSAGNISAENIVGEFTGAFDPSILNEFTVSLTTIIDQLDYIASTLITIKNSFSDSFNFAESESQIELLTNKVKELEAELLKLQQESAGVVATGETSGKYDAQIESAEKLVEAEEKVAEASQKAKTAIEESKTSTSAEVTTEAVGAEAKVIEEAGEASRVAAEGKREFAEANQQVASTANETTGATKAEAEAIREAGEASKEAIDKRITTTKGEERKDSHYSEIESARYKNKYETTKTNYKWGKDKDTDSYRWIESTRTVTEDFKKIRDEQIAADKKIALAQNKLKTWFRAIENQTFGKANYIGEYETMVAAYGRDASGLTTMDDLTKALNGMEKVQARIKEIQTMMTKGNTSSLNPWQNASIAESSLSTSVDELARDAAKLKQLPPEIANSISEINDALAKFQGMSLDKGVAGKTRVDIDTYAKAFGDLSLKIRETRTAIKDEKIFESTNAVYDPYAELSGQVSRYGTVSKRMTRAEIEGKTSSEAYKKDATELESVLERIYQLEENIRSRPFYDENKINAAAVKMNEIRQSLEDMVRQSQLAETKTSEMTKMTSDKFNENVKSYEQMVRGWLKSENFTPLNDDVTINFANGIAKVSAQIRDADGEWRKFTADIDASGSLLNIKTPFANAKESAKFANAEAVSKAQKFTLESYQKQYTALAKQAGDYLTQNGMQFLGENPSIQLLENGLAKVSAKIKDAQGNWHNFAMTVDADGNRIGNVTMKAITSNVENLERQLAGGTLASDFTSQATASYDRLIAKLREGQAGYQGIIQDAQRFQTIASTVTTQEGLDAFNKGLAEVEERYKRLNKLASMAGKNSSLIMSGNEIKQFRDIEDAVAYAKEYASGIGKIRNITGQMTSDVISEGGMGKFTIQVKNAQGEIKNLKFAYDDMQKSMMSNASIGGIERTGLLGYLDRVGAKLQNLTAYWTAMLLNPYMIVGRIKEIVNVVVQLDEALVDLRKTTTMSSHDLNSFYYDANESAKKLGVTTKEIISQAADWSRLGYSDKEGATRMAELSSQFASISPGMDVGTATEGLVSTMKAFDVQTEDVKEGIMSKINAVGNAFAETNANIITGLEKSSAAMAAANNSMEETVALFTAGQEIVQNPQTVGSSLRTIAMRIRGKFIVPICCESNSLCYAI